MAIERRIYKAEPSAERYWVRQKLVVPIEVDLDAAAASVQKVMFNTKIHILRVQLMVTETVANDNVAAVVEILDTDGTTSLGTLTVPDATAAKECIQSAELEDEDDNISTGKGQIVFNHKTKGTDTGASAGKGYMMIEYTEYPTVLAYTA